MFPYPCGTFILFHSSRAYLHHFRIWVHRSLPCIEKGRSSNVVNWRARLTFSRCDIRPRRPMHSSGTNILVINARSVTWTRIRARETRVQAEEARPSWSTLKRMPYLPVLSPISKTLLDRSSPLVFTIINVPHTWIESIPRWCGTPHFQPLPFPARFSVGAGKQHT